VFKALALYTIAKREGYDKKWMAFVPVLNTYYIGKVSDKNRIFNMPSKVVGLVAAILEGIIVVSYIIYLSALFVLADNGCLGFSVYTMMGTQFSSVDGFEIGGTLTDDLNWAVIVFNFFDSLIVSIINLAYYAFEIMLLVVFFQTYSSRHYVMFTIFSIIFPLSSILMFVVRNNSAKNYRQYIREQQERQYRAYQEYNRRNMNNPYNYNPYSGRTQPPPTGNPYEAPRPTSAPSDPFEDFGSTNNNSNNSKNSSNASSNGDDNTPSDPFGDL
jgi:hypothetical protein